MKLRKPSEVKEDGFYKIKIKGTGLWSTAKKLGDRWHMTGVATPLYTDEEYAKDTDKRFEVGEKIGFDSA